MSKTAFLAKIKLFISSHLVPVVATSSILVVGASAGVIAVIVNSQPKQEIPEISDNSQKVSKEEKEPENSDNTEESEDNSSEQDKSDNSASTTQNQNNTSSQPKPTEQPSSSNSNSNSSATPSKPSTPTQPTTPVEPTKTEYFYVCKGTIPDPATKAQMLAEFPGADDHITLTLNGPYKITNCWNELKSSSMVDPNYTKYFTWQLIECNSLEEMNSYLN